MKQNSPAPIPVWIWIDPTRRCNLACSLCYTKPAHKHEDLCEEVLERILSRITDCDDIAPQELTFNWRGEPLMNRRLHTLLKMVAASGLRCPVQFHTNAMLLTPQRAAELVDACADLTIYVSIDGGSEESHDRNRGRGSFRRALAGAANLMAARGSSHWPRIVVYQLDLKEPEANYDPAFLALTRLADDWLVASPVLPDGDGRPFLHAAPAAGGSRIVDEWSELPRDYPQPRGPCFFAGNALVVAPDGKASICILSNDDRGLVGDLMTESVGSILRRARHWRSTLANLGRGAISHCAACRKCEGAGQPRSAASPPQSVAQVETQCF